MFGCKSKVGLTSTSLPREVVERLQSEDNLICLPSSPTNAKDKDEEGQINPGTDGDEGQINPSPDGDEGQINPGPDGDEGQINPGPDCDEGHINPGPDGDEGQINPGPDGNEGQTNLCPGDNAQPTISQQSLWSSWTHSLECTPKRH